MTRNLPSDVTAVGVPVRIVGGKPRLAGHSLVHPVDPVRPQAIGHRRDEREPEAWSLSLRPGDWAKHMALSKTKRVYLSPPHMSARERELLLDAFDSNWVAPLGPHVDAFEREFAEKIGMKHAVALSSGTAALHIALAAPGRAERRRSHHVVADVCRDGQCDHVPVGSAGVCRQRAAELEHGSAFAGRGHRCRDATRPSVRKPSWSWTSTANALTTKSVGDVCRAADVPLIEDAAEALGASYQDRPAGTFGVFGCFSFNGNKIITTSGGGMLVTDDEQAAQRRGSWPRRRAIPHRTMNTRRSATTTA